MKLSIIIPTLEEEKILEKMLLSLKQLTKFDHEIIISDGHSKDKTVEIARKYANKVIVHDGKTRQTIAQGRNRGAEVANGDFFVFLDSDVFIPNINEFFTKTIAQFEKDKKLVALTVKLKSLPEYKKFGDGISWALLNFNQYFMINILHIGSASGEFQMFRKDAFQKIKGYSEDNNLVMHEDAEIFSRMLKIGKAKLCRSLYVMHTSRRAHNMGWTKLWITWFINTMAVIIRKKPIVKEWKVSR